MRWWFTVAFTAYIGLLSACSGGSSTKPSVGEQTDNSNVAKELPLPIPPSSLTTPEERGKYMVLHFWDALDKLSPQEYGDTAVIEQTFANFINLLQYVSDSDKSEAIEILVKKSTRDNNLARLIDDTAEKYLDEPNSPMRSEDLYILFLNNYINNTSVPEEIRERSKYRLNIAMKNRPGMKSADFKLVTRDNNGTTFHKLLAKVHDNIYTINQPDTVLVIFYDPECSQCREITGKLIQNKDKIEYPVLAVDVAENIEKWKETNEHLPQEWQVAFSTTPIEDKELYIFPALPSLYLITSDGTVILKDFPISL